MNSISNGIYHEKNFYSNSTFKPNLLYCNKIIYPTKDELESHKKFLKSKISKNFF